MQAIAALEAEQRGPYGGAIGFFAPDDVEVAITIRSMVLKDGTAYVHAGAGIVADSVPARESAEVAAKAGAVLAALAEAENHLRKRPRGDRPMTTGKNDTPTERPGLGLHILLIDNYDSFTYNLYQYLCELGAQVDVTRNDEITLEAIGAMEIDGIVVSPGPSRPENAGVSMAVIERFGPTVPILGVCLGHQSIGLVYGGDVVTVEPVHGKKSAVDHRGTGVFEGLPTPLQAGRYHSLAVDRATLPDVLEVTATSADGLVMGLRHREYPVEGIQFHPESILTTDGMAMLATWLRSLHPRRAR